ncbi:vacuolar import and degradation protein-domain-containing protein [Aspergillus foveolatus]|uniref:vacuolar import and degradation protein-domain-containing protein n=1 Tax=Aspergillus foveolatus TaxID=210207 RepID=UPI003CCCD255
MPTPSDSTSSLTATSVIQEISARTTCPPEPLPSWRQELESASVTERDSTPDNALSPGVVSPQPALSRADDAIARADSEPLKVEMDTSASPSSMSRAEDERAMGRMSPSRRSANSSSAVTSSPNASLLSYEFSNIRLLPNYTSSFLRPGSKFTGTQQSDRQVYNVDVEIKHVDMAESYLCGYLRIQGLTEDHPTLTTFFEGEIIGTKHTFKTRNESWGASEKTDMLHWARFPAWRPLAKQAKRSDFTYWDFAERDHIFMRWKEHFLVPDHRVRTISGASFEGFYYICFNQVEGTVSGIYFHAKSEKYQQLDLKHVENHGCTPAIEFR